MKYLRLLPIVALLALGTAAYAGDKAKDDCKDCKDCTPASECCKEKADKAACCKEKAEKKDSAKKPE